MKVASVNFEVTPIQHADDFFSHLTRIVGSASAAGASVIVLPEYTIAELYSVVDDYQEENAPQKLTPFARAYVNALSTLSNQYEVMIVGGTFFEEKNGSIFNVCPITSPRQKTIFQLKNRLVTYEREVQKLSMDDTIVPLSDAHIGVLICYDSEFPSFARTHCERGVQLLCVPSSTETIHGFNRVRYSCIARAIENQIYVVHSALVGSIGKEPISTSYGSSAIIAPCSPEFFSGPVIAETKLHVEDIAYATLDFGLLTQCRENGEVRNWHDRPKL